MWCGKQDYTLAFRLVVDCLDQRRTFLAQGKSQGGLLQLELVETLLVNMELGVHLWHVSIAKGRNPFQPRVSR